MKKICIIFISFIFFVEFSFFSNLKIRIIFNSFIFLCFSFFSDLKVLSIEIDLAESCVIRSVIIKGRGAEI
jgi:hypothetical protein